MRRCGSSWRGGATSCPRPTPSTGAGCCLRSFYYVSAYCDLLRDGHIQKGDKINVCVPTGNFGNILAAYYAGEMGVPIGKLICASNSNNVLTDFLKTGVYDRNRTFYNTMSPSMDILISSNLERLLFALSGHDDALVRGYMAQLSQTGRYEVGEPIRRQLERRFAAGFCDDAETQKVIGRMWQEHHYLIDTHTAVAFDVLEQYRRETGDRTPAVVPPPPAPSSSATMCWAPWGSRIWRRAPPCWTSFPGLPASRFPPRWPG